MPPRRSWFRLSLRSLFVTITLCSVLFAWQFYYRAQKVRERERILKLFAGTKSHCNIYFHLFGWQIPEKATWLEVIATPEPVWIGLRAEKGEPLPDAYCEVARRCSQVEYDGGEGGNDAFLRKCLSAKTEELKLFPTGVSVDCLASVHECPNLRKVDAKFVSLSAKSLQALLSHPQIETLEISDQNFGLKNLPELSMPNALRHLDVDTRAELPSFESMRRIPYFGSPGTPRTEAKEPKSHFNWLRQCQVLEEVSMSMPRETEFVEAVGKHLSGVNQLNVSSPERTFLDSLGSWTRLRRLCIAGVDMDDELLALICKRCTGVHTLEIDEYSHYKELLTAKGLSSLRTLPSLKRLRLGGCKLTAAHTKAIAELTQLEELSLEDQSLGDAAIEPLRKLASLKRISLERNKAGSSTFSTIRGDWENNRPYRS